MLLDYYYHKDISELLLHHEFSWITTNVCIVVGFLIKVSLTLLVISRPLISALNLNKLAPSCEDIRTV